LWIVHKKKAIFTIGKAHGVEEPQPMDQVTSEVGEEVLSRLRKDDTRRPIARAITAISSVPGTDTILTGSWDGWIRVWKLTDDKRALISHGVVGGYEGSYLPNGLSVISSLKQPTEPGLDLVKGDNLHPQHPVRGVVNSLAVWERRKHNDGDTTGLCIVAATGKEPRLGRWRKFGDGARNGAVVFEVPLYPPFYPAVASETTEETIGQSDHTIIGDNEHDTNRTLV
jgi:ribosomal RNA-processing protein 9